MLIRFIEWLADRRRDHNVLLICMRQEDTWRWPDYLGAQTAGKCAQCKAPIYFEAQNKRFKKICQRCHEAG